MEQFNWQLNFNFNQNWGENLDRPVSIIDQEFFLEFLNCIRRLAWTNGETHSRFLYS